MGLYALSRKYGMIFLASFLITCMHHASASSLRDKSYVFSLNELFNLDEDLHAPSGSKTAAIIIPSASATYSTSPKTAASLKISKSPSNKVTPSNTRPNHNAASDISLLDRPLKYVKVSVLPSDDETHEQENAPPNPKQTLASVTLPPATKPPQVTSPPQRGRPQNQNKRPETVLPNKDGGPVASIPIPVVTTPRSKPAKPWQTTPASFRQSSDLADETINRNSHTRPTVRSRVRTTTTPSSGGLQRQRVTVAPLKDTEETTKAQNQSPSNGHKNVNKALHQLEPIFKPMLKASDPTFKNDEPEKVTQIDERNLSSLSNTNNGRSKESTEIAPGPQNLPGSIAEILDFVERLKKDKEPDYNDFKDINENRSPVRPSHSEHESLTPRIVNKFKANQDRIIDFPSVSVPGPNRENHDSRPDPVFRPRPAIRAPLHDSEFVENEDHRLQRPGSHPKPDLDDPDDVTRPPTHPKSPTRVQTRPPYDDRPLQRPLVRESITIPNDNQGKGLENQDEQYPIEGLVPHEDSKEDDFDETQPIELPLHMLKELLVNAKPTIKEVAIHSDYDPKPKIIHPVRNTFIAAPPNSNRNDELKSAEGGTKNTNREEFRPQDQSGDSDRFKGPLYRNTVAATTFRPTTTRTTVSSKTNLPVRGLNPITNQPLYPDHPDALVVPPPKEFLERYRATTTAPSIKLEYDDVDAIPQRGSKIPLIQDEDEGSFDTSDEEDFATVTLPPSSYGKKIRDFIQNPNVEISGGRPKGGVSDGKETIRPFIPLDKNKQPTFPRISIKPQPPTSNEDFIVASTPLPLSQLTHTRFRDSEIEDHREFTTPKGQQPSGNERRNQESSGSAKNRETQKKEENVKEIQPHQISIFHNDQNHEDHRGTQDWEDNLNRKSEGINRQNSPKNQTPEVRLTPLENHGTRNNHEAVLINQRPAENHEFESKDHRPVQNREPGHRERRPGGNRDRDPQNHQPESRFQGERITDKHEHRKDHIQVENRDPEHDARRPGANRDQDRRAESPTDGVQSTLKVENHAQNRRPVENREPQQNRYAESPDRRPESQIQDHRSAVNLENHAHNRRPVENRQPGENRDPESQDRKVLDRNSQNRRPIEPQNHEDLRIRYQEAERVHQITPEPPSRIYQPPHKEFEPNWFTPATQPPAPPVTFPPYQEKIHLVAGVTVRPHNIVIEKDFKPIRPDHSRSPILGPSLIENRVPESFLSTPRPEPPLRPLFKASEEDDSPPINRGVPESENRRPQNREFDRNSNDGVSIHDFRRGNIHQNHQGSQESHTTRKQESGRSPTNSRNHDESERKPSDPPIYIPESLRSQGNRDRESGKSPTNARVTDSFKNNGQRPPVYIPESLRSQGNRDQESEKSPPNARVGDSADDNRRRPSNPTVNSPESWSPLASRDSDRQNHPTEAPSVENQRIRPTISLTSIESQVTRRPVLNPQRDPDDLEYRVHTAKDHKKQNRPTRPDNPSESADNSYRPPYVPLNETRLQSFTYSDEESKPKYNPGRHRHDKSFPMLPPAPPVALVPEKPVFPTDSENEVVNIPVNKDYAEHQNNLRQRLQDAARNMPKSVFRCDKVTHPGYYADVEAKCQVFHYCQVDKIRNTFVCPPGTLFNQRYRVCDWWYNVDCENSPDFYFLNEFYGPDAKL